eukprot:gene12866-biopygen8898
MCFSGKLEMTQEELGRGAFGVIYKGVDPGTGMILAVKIVQLGSSAAAEAEVRKEISLLERLEHPHIVNCHGSE